MIAGIDGVPKNSTSKDSDLYYADIHPINIKILSEIFIVDFLESHDKIIMVMRIQFKIQ